MSSLAKLLAAAENERLEEVLAILSETHSSSDIQAHAKDIYEAIKAACHKNSEHSRIIALSILQNPQLHSLISSVVAENKNEILKRAIEHNLEDVASILLIFEQVKTKAHYDDNEILETAVQKDNPVIVGMLLSIKEVRENAHLNKNFPLLYAAQRGNVTIGRLLLAQSNVREKAACAKNAALAAAAFGNHLAFVQLLCENKNVKEKSATQDNQALRFALENNSVEVMQFLLTLDQVKQALIKNPELVMALCQFPVLLPAMKPLVSQIEFYGFTLKEVIKANHLDVLLSQENIEKFFQDPLRFIQSLPKDAVSLLKVEALKINAVNKDVERLENAYKANSETAMSPRALNAAKVAYAKAQELYANTFNEIAKRCGGQLKAIEEIEQNIRTLLLEKIKQNTHRADIIAFINNNKEALAKANNSKLMVQAYAYFNSNTDINQVAWRAYDCFAPVASWPNLLTPPLQSSKIYAAGMTDDASGEVDINMGSLDVRQRVAFYYLALQDIHVQATLDKSTREAIFIGQIAEIRRAHNGKSPAGMDNPSCYPGTVGRIATMGAGHPLLHVVDPIAEISNVIFNMLNDACQQELAQRSQDESEIEKLHLALTALTSQTIEMLKEGKTLSFNLLTNDSNMSEEEIITLRTKILQRLGTLEEVFNKINREYEQRQPKIRALANDEMIYVQRQLVDICFNSVGNKVADNYKPSTLQREQSSRINVSDPFNIQWLQTQLREQSLTQGIMSIRASDELRLKMALQIAQCKNEIYQDIYPKLKVLLPHVEEQAVATFACLVASNQFSEYTSIKEMQEQWPHKKVISELILEKAQDEYLESPLSTWAGPANIKDFANALRMLCLQTSLNDLRL